MSSNPRHLADSERPWIGLASFTEDDSEFFAGRGEETEELLRLVRRDTLTLLYGVSGLGKTSLLRAGLFPRLHAEDALPVPIRLDHLDDSTALSAQVHRAIAAAATAAGVERPDLRADETLWEYFHRTGHDFWSRRNEPVTPVLVFDQFEEMFTIGRETSERARRADIFIAELAELVENRAPAALRADPPRAADFDFTPVRLKVLLSMREDYLADLDRLKSRFRDLGSNRLRLLPMGEAQARAVIAVGQPLLAPGVDDRILAFVAGSENAAADEDLTVAPALLSLVLRELNERRLTRGAGTKITADLLDLEQMKILEGFYLRSLEGCPDSTRVFIEDALLTAGGYRNSCALDDALAREGVTKPILDELVNRRLLAYEDRHRSRRVELTHDVLVPVVKASRNARRAREERERAEKQEREALALAESARAEAESKARSARRQLLVAGVLVAVALAGAAFGLVGRFQAQRAEEQVQDAVASGDLELAVLLQEQADVVVPRALAHLARALKTKPDAQLAREFLVSLLRDSPWCLPTVEPLLVTGAVIEARFTDNGQQTVIASRDGVVSVRDTTTGATISEHKIPKRIQTLSQDGRRLLTADDDKTVQVWDSRTGEAIGTPMKHEPYGGPLSTVNFSSDGSRVVTASGGFGGNARVWSADTGLPLADPTENGEGVLTARLSRDGQKLILIFRNMDTVSTFGRVSVRPWNGKYEDEKRIGMGSLAVFSDDGRRVVVARESEIAEVFETETGKSLREGPRHGGWIVSASFSPDGQWVVTGSQDRTARIWNAESGQPRSDSLVHDNTVVAVSFSRDGQRVLTVSQDNTARVWSTERERASCEPLRHAGPIVTAAFDPNGARALTASEDKTARLWDLDSGEATGTPLGRGRAIAAAFSDDGTAVIRLHPDGSTQMWDANTGDARGNSLPAREGIEPAAISAGGKRVVHVSRSSLSAQVWDTHSGKTVGNPIVHEGANQELQAQLSADGTRIVTSYAFPPPQMPGQQSQDGDARVWKVETGELIGKPIRIKPGHGIGGVSSDGRVILIAPDNTAQIWDATTGQQVGQSLRHEDLITAASFSRDGHQVVTSSVDKSARVWNAHSGEPITEPLRVGAAARSASFSRDGARIVVSAGRTASTWDAKTGKSLGRLLRHDQSVSAAAFSADGQRIVTLSDQGTTHVWDLTVDTTSPLPNWLPELAEAVAGQRFDDAGLLVPAKALIALRRELMTPGSPRELKGDDFWSRFGRWFFTRGPERTISPNSKITRAELHRLRAAAAAR